MRPIQPDLRSRSVEPVLRPGSVQASPDASRPASSAAADEEASPWGPASHVELSAEALMALAEERAREEELLDLRRRLPGARREAEVERRELEEQEEARLGLELTEDEERVVDTLQRWDREIRTHEAAHVAQAGGLAGTPTYETVTGPDGRQYAVGGSVKIDLSDAGSDHANADKMRRVKAAATAVGDPSAADMRVAAKAERRLQDALRERAARSYEAQSEA